ncbi:hypothetical protein [Streptomyces sp. NPDC004284]|uniref:hypothetical protein n=1 Tax=Streptomyces sp. NPDC004284 TaxID=3364695 RepID=UPI0036B51826
MARVRNLGAVTASSVIAVSLLASCSGGGGDGADGGPPALGDVPRINRSADIPGLPMDAYTLTKDQFITFMAAQRIAARTCMARFGFDYKALDSTIDPAKAPPLQPEKPSYFGIIDEDRAARFGYQSPDLPPGMNKRPTGGANTTEAEQAVYTGKAANQQVGGETVPEGGCAKESGVAVQTGAVDGINILATGNERIDAHERALVDDRMKKVHADWSACMKKAGYDYATPKQAVDDEKWHHAGPRRPDEIATAKADVACKRRTNVVGTWWALTEAYERRYVENNAEHLADVKKSMDVILRNSARVIEKGD